MTITLETVGLALVVVLALTVVGLRELVAGYDQRRRLSGRGVLDTADHSEEDPLQRLDVRLRRTSVGRLTARRIAAAGLRMRVSVFLLALAGAALLTIIVISQVLAPLLGLAAALVVGLIFFGYLRRQEDRRREEFITQLPDLARVLANASAAGLVIRTAIEMAAEELDEPARTELGRTAQALRVGQSLDEALRDLADRLPSREIAVLVSTLIVASRAGGSLVTALRNITDALEQRKETRREVKTILGQSVFVGYVICGMGVGSLFMVNAISPGAVARMASQPLGQAILVVAFGLFGMGIFLIRRVARIDA
jgi:tight adherence protein B